MDAVAQISWYFFYFILIFAGAAFPAGKILFWAYGKLFCLQILIVAAALLTYFTCAYLLYRLTETIFPWLVPPM